MSLDEHGAAVGGPRSQVQGVVRGVPGNASERETLMGVPAE